MVAEVDKFPPVSPSMGDEWFDIGTTGELYVWDGTQWVSASGASDNKLDLEITTDKVATNPEFPVSSSEDMPELKNQLEVNRWLSDRIDEIEVGSPDAPNVVDGGSFKTAQEFYDEQ